MRQVSKKTVTTKGRNTQPAALLFVAVCGGRPVPPVLASAMVDLRPMDTEYTVAFREGRVMPSVLPSDKQGSHIPGGNTMMLGKSPKRQSIPVARRPYFWEFPAGASKDRQTGRPLQEHRFAATRADRRNQHQDSIPPYSAAHPASPSTSNPFEVGGGIGALLGAHPSHARPPAVSLSTTTTPTRLCE